MPEGTLLIPQALSPGAHVQVQAHRTVDRVNSNRVVLI